MTDCAPELYLSPRSSTSNLSCLSSSYSSAPARTSALLRLGSSTVTSKGTYLPFFLRNVALFFEYPYGTRQIFGRMRTPAYRVFLC
jgi:hypothetical protein